LAAREGFVGIIRPTARQAPQTTRCATIDRM
jgi:hypothetical protein